MNSYLRQIAFSIGLLLIGLSKSFAQSDTVSFFIDTVDAVASVPIEVPVKVSNFEGVVGFQFSMEWDTDTLKFDSIGHLNLFGLVPAQFNLLNTDNGVLTLSWNDPNVLNGITVADSTAIFSLFFEAFPECDSSAQLRFVEMPTSFDVTLINDNNQVVQVPYFFGDGVIEARCPILEADFAMNGDSIQDLRVCAPFELILTDSSFGELGISQWTWIAGNGQMSTDTNTTFLYEVPGVYSASLIIEDDFSMDTVAFEVIVDPIVDVDFTFQLDLCGSTFVSFNGINNGTSNIIAWDWDFGNGISSLGQNTFQAYDEYDTDYTVVLTVTDQNGCMSSVEKIVNIPFVALVEADPFEIQLPGCDTASGQIILETTGGLAPYTYAWSHDNTLTDSIAAGLNPGDYTVTVTDALGCIGTTTTFLTSIDSFPVVDLGLDTSFCIGGSINLDAGEEGEEYEWLLDDNTLVGALNSILSADQTGTYIANVTNEFNCTTSDTLVLDVFELPEVHLGTDTTICESDTLTLNAETDASIFNWSLNNNLLNEGGQSLEVNQAGTYTVEVTDNNACSNTDEIVIVFSDPPIIELGADTTICEGEDILWQVPDEGYDYEWYLNQNTLVGSTNVLSTNLEGDYALIATNQDGCKFEDGIELEVAPLPIVDLGADTSLCFQDSIFLFVNNPDIVNYEWYLNDVHLDFAQDGLVADEEGLYIVNVISAAGCLNKDSLKLDINDPLNINIGEDTTICNGDDLELGLSGYISYEWRKNGNSISNDSFIIIDEEAIFSVTVEDEFGCFGESEVEIESFEFPLLNLGEDTSICTDDSYLISIEGFDNGFTFQWYRNGQILDNQNNDTLLIGQSGNYGVEISNLDACMVDDNVDIMIHPVPNVNLGPDRGKCVDHITVLSPIGNDNLFEFKWFLNGEVLDQDSILITVINSGIYTLEAFNDLGCSNTDTISIFPLPEPIIQVQDPSFIGCSTDTIKVDLEVSMSDSIQWFSNGIAIDDWTSASQSFINHPGGTFEVFAYNEFNCGDLEIVTVQVLPAPEFDLGSDTTKCSNETIPISFTPSGETVDTIKWSLNNTEFFPNASTFHDASDGGIYQVEVIGENGCSRSDTIIIEDFLNPDIHLPDDTTLCTGNVFLLWDQNNNLGESSWFFEGELINSNNQQISVSEAGQYILEVEGENNCSGRDTIDIDVSIIGTPNLQENFTFCSENQVINSNIGENYPHEWTLNDQLIQSSAVDSLVVTQGGIYTVTVFNEDNCSASDTIIITQGEIPDIELGEDLELCEEELANFLVNEGYMYTWLLDGEAIDDETGNTLTTDKSGTYMVVATSEDGCESTDEAEVIIHPLPEIELGMDASICPEDSYNLDASCVDCEVVWNDGSTEDVRDINMAGEYIATVTNEFDCSVMDTFKLNLYEAAMPDLGEDIELCLNETVTLDPGFFSTYQWSIGTDAPSIDLIAADVFAGAVVNYWVDVSTPDGCVGSDSIRVTYLPLINGLIEAPTDHICLGDSLQLLATGGTFYEWSAINGDAVSINDPFSQDPMVSPTENMTYQVIVGNDCPTDLDTAYYEVAVLELPNGDAGQDTCIAEGTDIFLNASGGETYLWSLNEIYPLSNLESPTPRVAPMESTTYFVTITGLNGCSVLDSVLIGVAEDPSFNIIPVNIITPNGDGKNDFLAFDNLEKFPRNTLKVYNRWGNKVYEKVAYENDWDGTYQGKPLPAGSYYYILSFQASQVVVKSALTILRE